MASDIQENESKGQKENLLLTRLLTHYLIWSVIISVSIIIFGVILFFITGKTGYSYNNLNSLITARGNLQFYPFSVASIFSGIAQLKPFAIIQLGVLVLLLTPFGRILMQFFIFLYEKDYKFTVIALVVFLILMFSLYMVNFISIIDKY